MPNDSAAFLLYSRQKPGDINKGQQWDVEGIAESHKPGGFVRSIDVQHTCHHAGLISHDTYRPALKTAESDDQVRRESRLYLEKVVVIDNAGNDRPHIVGDLWIHGHNRIHVGIGLYPRIEGHARWIFEVIRRQKAQQSPA